MPAGRLSGSSFCARLARGAACETAGRRARSEQATARELLMKRTLQHVLVILILLSWRAASAAASPSLQGTRAEISSPADNAVVRGTVPIVGTATDPDFWKYEVHYALGGTEQWILVDSIRESQVLDGLLETWETISIPDGSYSLRLRVVNRTSNYQQVFVRGIAVANAAPTDTPEPTPTPTPTATITPAATPTFIIPTSPLAQPTATPTLARPPRSALPEVLNVNAWRQSVCLGAQLMALVLAAIGVIFVLRRLI